MIIELRGVEFVNKGAQLMLHAIITKVKEQVPEALFVMSRGDRTPASKLRESDIYIKLNGGRYSRLGRYLPTPVRRRLGYVLDNEIQVVLDGSGFALGDQWGASYAERRLGVNIARWKEQGKKIILLPQAFGPFEEPRLREIMSKILLHADLIFAREEQSYQYLRGISETANFRLAPDFTNLVKGRKPSGFNGREHEVAIIPNYKMIDKNEGTGNAYFNFLLGAIRNVSEFGLRPYFLIHEGQRDLAIAEKINRELDNTVPVITEQDPLVIKGIIASACFIVCSRFHGIVSALSQSVPCIVTGWSHKYEMLLQEYDFGEGLIRDLEDHIYTRDLIRKLADTAENQAISKKLSRVGEIQQERSRKMWETVFEVINN